MSIILALDISSVSTGFALFNDGELTDNYGLIKLNHDTHGEKLNVFEARLQELFNTYQPTNLIIEEIWRGPNPKTFKVLAYYHGILQYAAFKWNKIQPLYLAPSQARSIVGEHFGVNLSTKKDKKKKKPKKDAKELAFDFVKKKYGFKSWKFKTENDITDAIILGLAGSLYEAHK